MENTTKTPIRPATQRTPFRVQIGAVGHRTKWVAVADFAAASRACREFIEAHDLGASEWRGGEIVHAATKKGVAKVTYNGRLWLPNGAEAGHTAEEFADRLRRNADSYHFGRVSHAQYSEANHATWRQIEADGVGDAVMVVLRGSALPNGNDVVRAGATR